MPRRSNNIEAYIAHKVHKELDKTIEAMIEHKFRQLKFSNIGRQAAIRHNRNALDNFGRTFYQTQLSEIDWFKNFGASQSQFINAFALEIKKSLFRDV